MGLLRFQVSLSSYPTYFQFSIDCIFELSLEHVKEKLALQVKEQPLPFLAPSSVPKLL